MGSAVMALYGTTVGPIRNCGEFQDGACRYTSMSSHKICCSRSCDGGESATRTSLQAWVLVHCMLHRRHPAKPYSNGSPPRPGTGPIGQLRRLERGMVPATCGKRVLGSSHGPTPARPSGGEGRGPWHPGSFWELLGEDAREINWAIYCLAQLPTTSVRGGFARG
jgi:hypothetical protein